VGGEGGFGGGAGGWVRVFVKEGGMMGNGVGEKTGRAPGEVDEGEMSAVRERSEEKGWEIVERWRKGRETSAVGDELEKGQGASWRGQQKQEEWVMVWRAETEYDIIVTQRSVAQFEPLSHPSSSVSK
jgi:hypothetical protein